MLQYIENGLFKTSVFKNLSFSKPLFTVSYIITETVISKKKDIFDDGGYCGRVAKKTMFTSI